jgi:hypothetical protein
MSSDSGVMVTNDNARTWVLSMIVIRTRKKVFRGRFGDAVDGEADDAPVGMAPIVEILDLEECPCAALMLLSSVLPERSHKVCQVLLQRRLIQPKPGPPNLDDDEPIRMSKKLDGITPLSRSLAGFPFA